MVQTAQLRPLRGFDRLAAAGFSASDIAQFRAQFHARELDLDDGASDEDADEAARAREEAWIDALDGAPRADALLARFTRTFPCTFFLGDFRAEAAPLAALAGGADGVALGAFLAPFLDAMIAGRAWAVVGTEQSTYSAFVADVLWRTYHGFEIVQRG